MNRVGRLVTRHRSLLWPQVPQNKDALVLALHSQFAQSERELPDKVRRAQFAQVRQLLDHAVAHVPIYRERLAGLYTPGGAAPTPEQWRRFPILTRKDVQQATEILVSEKPIREHGKIAEVRSSGTTGIPVVVKTNEIDQLFLEAINLRFHVWHRRDFGQKMGSITRLSGNQIDIAEKGKPTRWMSVFQCGPGYFLDIGRPANEQLAWLRDNEIECLMTYPSNLMNLIKTNEELEISLPKLREVSSRSELLSPEIRNACQRQWNVRISETYSAQELGIVALQCPETENLHVMAEHYIVEILDNAGEPCAPGETGRIVATSLHNFISPLIRYEIGDYAEVGEQCPCGRTLPTLKRIVGRVRNMVVLADGTKMWPAFGTRSFHDIAPVRQHQIIQTAIGQLEVKIVPERPFTTEETEKLAKHIESRLPGRISATVTFHDSIPPSPSGKFEDFMSLVEST